MRFFTARHSLRLGTALLVVGFATAAAAQSLAELAKKEQARRKAVGSATKVITNKDLPPSRTPAPPAAPGTVSPPPPPSAAQVNKPDEKKPDEPGDNVQDEASWRGRMQAAREELRRNEMFQEALQSRINALSNDFVNRDDPYQRGKIAADRQTALAELERVKADVEKATKAIADIEEDARKAGVPPGWVR